MRSVREGIDVSTMLHMVRTLPRRSRLHRRFQIAIVVYRQGKTWKSPVIKKLVDKYGAHEC